MGHARTTVPAGISGSPLPQLTIRPMQMDDLASVGRLETEIFPDPWDLRGMGRLLRDPNLLTLVAEDNRGVIGYAFAWILEGQMEILNLAVSLQARRTGVGKQLMTALMQAADASGCQDSFLEVRHSNTAAIRLYQSFDFTVSGKRLNYYRDGEDALVMRRSS